jgi:RHS repeat-associated protein
VSSFNNGATTTTSRTETYAYDALSRLTSVSYGDGESQAYSFDTMGNRTSKTDSGGSGSGATYTFDAANRLTSVTPTGGATAAVTFDADGNTLTDASGRTYTWDSENRMVSCTYQGDTTTYTYGYDGLRRSSTKDSVTTDYVYDGTNLVAEMRPNASGNLVTTTSYLLGSQGIEAKIDENAQTEAYYKIDTTTGSRLFDSNNNLIVAYRGVTSWYIYDGHGNVVGTVNGVTGAFTANPTLDDVYGVPRASGAPATKQGYCGNLGHVTDDTGLVYMKARYYDPGTGRFASEDPSGNGTNWYIYAGDNPVNMVDQTGKNPICDLIAGLFIVYGYACMAGNPALGTGLMIAGFILLIADAIWTVHEHEERINGSTGIGHNEQERRKEENELGNETTSALDVGGRAGEAIALNLLLTDALIDSIGADA